MSTISTTGLYDEDLHGIKPANFITDEIHTLQVPSLNEYYFLIPKAAPFFVDSIEIYQVNNNGSDGVRFVEGVDFKVGHQFIEAMESVGRPIAGSIRFMRHTISGRIRIKYRTIGGQWGFNDTALLAELSRKLYNPLIRSWGQIDIIEATFPSIEHDQPIDSLVGSVEIEAALDRLGNIMEATASGTTESHLLDFNNPHQTTKKHVGLEWVPNFRMATDAQHLDGTSNSLFTHPLGVVTMIQKFGLDPLNIHIRSTGNVHGMVPEDIGLGKVPNYPASTATTAVDPTNNSSLMTPYTTALLIQSVSGDPRLDQLILDYNAHITADNPHNLSPADIGTLTEQQIIDLIGEAADGGENATFGGDTPEQWEDKFPHNDDLNIVLDEITETNLMEANKGMLIELGEPPVVNDPEGRIVATNSGYGAYLLATSNDLGEIITEPAGSSVYPAGVNANMRDKWLSIKNAYYFIRDEDGIISGGSDKINIPVGWAAGVGFSSANVSDMIWGNRNNIYVRVGDTGRVMKIPRVGSVSQAFPASDSVFVIWTYHNELDNRELSVVAKVQGDIQTQTAFGDASWVSAITPHLNNISTEAILDNCLIGNKYVVLLVSEVGEESKVKVLEITFGASISLKDVTSTIQGFDIRSQSMVPLVSISDVTMVDGTYNHFTISSKEQPLDELNPNINIFMFGSNLEGQNDVIVGDNPYVNVSAGKDFTVTVNSVGRTTFWGDSPDNSLIYNGNDYLEI